MSAGSLGQPDLVLQQGPRAGVGGTGGPGLRQGYAVQRQLQQEVIVLQDCSI